MFKLSNRSLDKLKGVSPNLVKVVKRAIEITPVDFAVVQGVRTEQEQRALYAQGRDPLSDVNRLRKNAGMAPITEAENKRPVTWTLKSNHLDGKAVDLAAYVGGGINWSPQFYDDIAIAMKRAARELKIVIEWGPDIGLKTDLGHYQIKE